MWAYNKKEINDLFKRENLICKISSQKIINGKIENIKGTGFFLNISNENILFNKCLITNNHILNENDIKINNKINIIYNNVNKIIEINGKRNVFTDIILDYTCIEIFDTDNINYYFNIDLKDINSYLAHDIFMLRYSDDEDELSFSNGKIISINDNIIKHTSFSKEDLSGSPIVSRTSNYPIIGFCYSSNNNNEYCFSRTINSIINDIINKYREQKMNSSYFYNSILAEINIKEKDKYNKIRIINSYEEFTREVKNKNMKALYKNKYENEKELKEKCEIFINKELIPFCYYYTFNKAGKYTIRYLFNKDLTKINHMFSECKYITNLNFSNLNSNNIIDMGYMCNGCCSLTNIDLSNFNTENVIDMSAMFWNCESLKNINLSNFNTKKVTDMSFMFSGCNFLENIDLSNFNTENVTDMSYMFSGCDFLTDINLANISFQKVNNMNYMFSGCHSLNNIKLNNFDIKHIKNKKYIFFHSNGKINVDLSVYNEKDFEELEKILKENKGWKYNYKK